VQLGDAQAPPVDMVGCSKCESKGLGQNSKQILKRRGRISRQVMTPKIKPKSCEDSRHEKLFRIRCQDEVNSSSLTSRINHIELLISETCTTDLQSPR
jgi:hypothetical protein